MYANDGGIRMSKSKQRTAATIVVMIIIAAIVVGFYYYLSNRKTPLIEFNKKKSQVQVLLDKDFKNNYPATPREVVKTYSSMLKEMHSGIKDDEVKSLALKMRDLFDDELINKNPEDEYLQNVFIEVAASKKKERKITNTLITNKKQEKKKTINGKEYATVYVSYTISHNSRYLENWKYLLRKNEKEEWKILGWEFVSSNNK